MTTPPPPPPFDPPGQGGPPMPDFTQQQPGHVTVTQPRNGMGTASLVLGILSIPAIIVVVGPLLGILAVIFGFIGRSKAKKGEANNGGVALAGIITGFVGIALGVIAIVVISIFADDIVDLGDCLNDARTQAEEEQCFEDF